MHGRMILQQAKTYAWYDGFTVLKTYAWFPRTSLELLSRKGLETMMCLIWYGLVTDFISRIFINLPHFQFCPFLGLFASRQKEL